MNIVIIGLGGIGSILSEKISRYLNYQKEKYRDHNIILVDGDYYESKNLERQEFSKIGDKSQVKQTDLQSKFDNLTFSAITEFITDQNINKLIENNDIVFLCVDNHKTRKLVSEYCSNLDDIILISGGNDLTDGNVQIFIRKEGRSLTPDLCAYHPEIMNPEDKSPDEMSCEELSKSEPQLYFTNLTVATIMCWVFYNIVIKEEVKYSEVYFDIKSMSVDPKIRLIM